MTDALMAALAADPLERLRWLVARTLGIAPYGQSDEQVVKCALHLLAEARAAAEGAGNPGFDAARFAALREEARHGA